MRELCDKDRAVWQKEIFAVVPLGRSPGCPPGRPPGRSEENFGRVKRESPPKQASRRAVSRHVVPLSPKTLRQLGRRHFLSHKILDLHGLRAQAACDTLKQFVATACGDVLVITGKGLHSQGDAVLRAQMGEWLKNLGAYVLAYGSARPAHGGSGAFYVRLRPK